MIRVPTEAPVWVTVLAREIEREIEMQKTLPTFTVATLPDVAKYVRRLIYVSDETGGATVAFSDGTNWRRQTDLAIVS